MSAEIRRLPRQVATDVLDPIFFHKSVVKVGTRFTYHGRLFPGTTWIVYRIWHIALSNGERVRTNPAWVVALKDRIEMRCEETGEIRSLSFDYISYSAIWRVRDTPRH
jgi:hypothetical protein